MKIKFKKINIIRFFITFCLLFLIVSISYKNNIGSNISKEEKNVFVKNSVVNGGPKNEGGFSYNSDGTVSLGQGMTSNGFYDSKTKLIIENGSLIKPENGKVMGQVEFQQNVQGKNNYLLIIMVDFVQQKFNVDDVTYDSYAFSLKGDAKKNIDIELPLKDLNAREFEYIIIREPNITELSITNKDEWAKLHITRDFYSWRLFLSDFDYKSFSLEYDKSYNEMGRNNGLTMELTKAHNKIMTLPTCKSLENVELVMGNSYNVDMDFALVSFLGWEQTEFEDGSLVKYVKIPSNKSIYLNLKLPKVNSKLPYQIIAFPKPYDKNFRYTMPPFSTFRTIVTPKSE
ncbi:hypothetical protein EDD66_105253 [Mobilisporobacter senegalensis]|uniref:Uncharacterized protein n=1 Tax=Mobilisporobacter senegalensis TaxID=1329262 RepID=A0A3N1XT23_9FIRM|nr:hypothetical protein [Mobilisporobacter senegalensis]ROR28312.1 hypothetical protein EDD66_105253 [Mobilisporobacter senegalensis]